MKADNIQLLEFISASKRTFSIPVYQRNYDWKSIQCKTLFKDIEAIAVDNQRASHFLGTIVYVEGESKADFRKFTVIDGQQRLTSIMLLLKAILDSTDDEYLKEEIKDGYLTNKYTKEEALRIKLKPMKSDADNYKKLINNHIKDMEESQVLLNYNLFKMLISESELSPEVIFQGVQKLEIVYIQLDRNKENPQLIFESLNSTGLDLTQADLIRNYLLMGEEYEQQERLYNEYWTKLENLLPDALISDFIRDYLTLKTGIIPKKDDVYGNFKTYFRSLDNFDSEGFLEELVTYGEYYSWFKYGNSPEEKINQRLLQLQRLKSTVVYPYVLNIFEDCYLYHDIDVDEVCKTLDVILSYVMRKLLCELPTNGLNKIFATMAKDVQNYKNDPTDVRVAKVLAMKKGKMIFPNDSLMKEKLLSRDSYKFPHIKYVLEQIERSKGKEIVDFNATTIEHIMPQTLSNQWKTYLGKKAIDIRDKYVHNLGNLTLTGYNSELSNLSFENKKDYYKASHIYMNKEISEYTDWTEKEILLRGRELINIICDIWKCPKEVKGENFVDMRTEFDFTDEVDVTGRVPAEFEICGEIVTVDSWKEFFVKVCTYMYAYDSQSFRKLVFHKDFQGRIKRIIDTTDNNMRSPVKIIEGIYLETNLSANELLNYTKLVIEKFAGLDDEFSFKLKPVKSI